VKLIGQDEEEAQGVRMVMKRNKRRGKSSVTWFSIEIWCLNNGF